MIWCTSVRNVPAKGGGIPYFIYSAIIQDPVRNPAGHAVILFIYNTRHLHRAEIRSIALKEKQVDHVAPIEDDINTRLSQASIERSILKCLERLGIHFPIQVDHLPAGEITDRSSLERADLLVFACVICRPLGDII